MMRAIIIAMMKLIPFLSRAFFFPSSFISKGKVTVPIMVNVVIKAATAVIDAPLLRRDAAKGNEIRAGICKIAPNSAIRSTPPNPACSPTILEISFGGTKPRNKPIKIMIMRTIGMMRRKDFAATASDCFAFALSLAKAKIRQPIAKTFMTIAVELILAPQLGELGYQ